MNLRCFHFSIQHQVIDVEGEGGGGGENKTYIDIYIYHFCLLYILQALLHWDNQSSFFNFPLSTILWIFKLCFANYRSTCMVNESIKVIFFFFAQWED